MQKLKQYARKSNKDQKNQNIPTRIYYTEYTLIFLLFSLLIYSFFLYNGKSLIASEDGMADGVTQHLTSFAYYGRYLRSIVRNLWINKTLEIPTYDLSIGFGGDILTTLSNYVIGDPLTILSVFCPMQYAEYLYEFLILLRLYLAGVAFSMYCRYQGKQQIYTLTGSLIYVFSAYPLIVAPLHPYFINPMIYLPLLLIGVDKMLKNEKGKLLYTGMITIAAISNFYFFYMLCIMVCIYTIFRYLMIFGKIEPKVLIKMIIKFIFYSLLGIAMASILFLPSIMNILSSSRLSVENYIPLFYQPAYYLQLLANFSSSLIPGYYSYLGYTSMGFIAVVVLFIKFKERKIYRYLSIAFLLFTIFITIPYFGHMLNGMTYVTNRWVWAMNYLIALITVYMLPLLPSLSTKERKYLLIISTLYALLIIGFPLIRTERSMTVLLLLAVTLLVISLLHDRIIQLKFSVVSLVLVMVMIWMNALFMYSPSENNQVSIFADSGTGFDLIKKNTPGAILDEVEDSSEYRYDTAAISSKNIRDNSAMLLEKNATSFYFSSMNKIAAKFNRKLYLNTTLEQKYRDMDKRTYLDALLGAKYCIVPKGSEKYLPYGYNHLVKTGETYTAYSTEYALPLCFTSDQWIPSDTFESLSVTQKQQALLQGIVIDHSDDLTKTKLSFTDSTRDVTIKTSDGVTREGNSFHVKKENATVTLTLDGLKNSETYLIFNNIHYTAKNPYHLYTKTELKAMTRYERNQLKEKYRYYSEPTAAYVQTKMGDRSNILELRTAKDSFYCNIHDFLVNMGYSEESNSTITLTFKQIGDYTYDNLSVVCQPMDQFGEQCKALQADAPSKVEYDGNQISTSVSINQKKLVCFAVPYSEGWTATVDGKEQELMLADGMYMALELDTGTHDIILHYRTPYLKLGTLISLLSIVIFLCLAVFMHYYPKKQGKK